MRLLKGSEFQHWSGLLLAGAELANVVNEAALEAVRHDATEVSKADIYNGIDRIIQAHYPPHEGSTTRHSLMCLTHPFGSFPMGMHIPRSHIRWRA